ncbi:MAG: HD domain-containing protein [Deltaproteobacteria bacterium]|nr:HD domain-containing protein [Deltaproteobacteria bacterium]
MKLFRVISFMLAFLTAVPVVVVGIILIDSTVDISKTLTWELQQERADHASRQMRAFFENFADDLDLLVSNLSVRSMNLRERQELLSFIMQKRPEINIIAFYDERLRPLRNLLALDSNRILPSELALHQKRIAEVDLDQLDQFVLAFSAPYAIDRQPRPELSIERRQERVVALLMRISGEDATFLGMELQLTSLQHMLDRMRIGLRGQMLLVDERSHPIARSAGRGVSAEDAGALEAQLPVLLYGLGDSASAASVSGARPARLTSGRDVLVAYSALSCPDWRILSVELLDDAYLASRRMTWHVVWVVVISLAAALGLGVLFAFGLTRPIGKLVHGSLAIARGRFGTELDIESSNEIGELAHTFNYMSRQLLYYDDENKKLVESLQQGYLETIRALANSIDAKDPYTRGHSGRVTRVAIEIGKALGLREEELLVLRYGGILHDIGKIGIREEILGKRSQLDDDERTVMQQHPVMGEKIIAPIDFLQPVRPLVRHHHEWLDGSGYPDGLAGEDIPLGARILAAADTYDAVTSERPYQKAVDNAEAIRIVERLRGRQLDPQVCDALIAYIQNEIASGRLRPEQEMAGFGDPTRD